MSYFLWLLSFFLTFGLIVFMVVNSFRQNSTKTCKNHTNVKRCPNSMLKWWFYLVSCCCCCSCSCSCCCCCCWVSFPLVKMLNGVDVPQQKYRPVRSLPVVPETRQKAHGPSSVLRSSVCFKEHQAFILGFQDH